MKVALSVLALGCVLMSGCATLSPTSATVTSSDSEAMKAFFVGYQPIDPYYVDTIKRYDAAAKKDVTVNWSTLDDEKKIPLLPLQSAQVTIRKNDSKAKASYLYGTVSGESGSYTVIMDYMKYRVEPIYADEEFKEFVCNGKVGVGLRIKAEIETKSANLNLASLYSIGLEASKGNLKGGISVDVIGIDSPHVTNLIPLTVEIDQTAIQGALQALASIKTKIYEKGTVITPHLIALNLITPENEKTLQEKGKPKGK